MKNVMAAVFLLVILLSACSKNSAVTSVEFIFNDYEAITNSEIYTVSADGSNINMLTDNDIEEIMPCWSPDGTKIAFAATNDRNNFEIYVMNADGSDMISLDNGSLPRWSPDGTKIAYMYTEMSDTFDDMLNGPNRDICVINADGTGKVRLTNDSKMESDVAWAPDGSRISYSSYDDSDFSQDIYAVNPDGSNLINLTDSIPREQDYAWSPDASKIVYSAWTQGETDSDIYIMNADSTEKTHIASNTSMYSYFMWSPDSTKLAFFSNHEGKGIYGDIYTVNADGSGLNRLTNIVGWINDVQLSPAGDKIVFSCVINPVPEKEPTEPRRIYVMNTDGSDISILTDEDDEEYYRPCWSPDGSKMVYICGPWDNQVIYTMKSDGSAKTKLISDRQCGSYTQWSPDGSNILLTAAR